MSEVVSEYQVAAILLRETGKPMTLARWMMRRSMSSMLEDAVALSQRVL